MPELPEVETIARALRDGGREGVALPGRTIRDVQVYWDRSIAEPGAAEFRTRLVGQTVASISRRAKLLIIQLQRSPDGAADTLLVHLRMSGDLRVEPASRPLEPSDRAHDRVVITFTDGVRLVFNDPRKFGRIWLVSNPDRVTGKLGPEPLEDGLTAGQFHQLLISRRRQLKPLLLDQTFLAGLGNIYTDEALHLAGLHPARISASLDPEEAARLLEAIRQVLNEGIRSHGASIDWVYRGGDFQNKFRVYRRTGLPCPVCGAPIERIVVAQRSTHFCRNCQSLSA